MLIWRQLNVYLAKIRSVLINRRELTLVSFEFRLFRLFNFIFKSAVLLHEDLWKAHSWVNWRRERVLLDQANWSVAGLVIDRVFFYSCSQVWCVFGRISILSFASASGISHDITAMLTFVSVCNLADWMTSTGVAISGRFLMFRKQCLSFDPRTNHMSNTIVAQNNVCCWVG